MRQKSSAQTGIAARYVRGNPADGLDPFGRLTFNVNKATSDTSLGTTIQVLPGVGSSPISSNTLAVTVLQWTISAKCKCSKSSKWYLDNTTVDMNAHISYRSSYASAAQSAWVHEKEQDHVGDFDWWGKNEGKKVAQQFETTQKKQAYDDQATCEKAASDGMQTALIPSAEAEVNQTIKDYDTSGKHTWKGP